MEITTVVLVYREPWHVLKRAYFSALEYVGPNVIVAVADEKRVAEITENLRITHGTAAPKVVGVSNKSLSRNRAEALEHVDTEWIINLDADDRFIQTMKPFIGWATHHVAQSADSSNAYMGDVFLTNKEGEALWSHAPTYSMKAGDGWQSGWPSHWVMGNPPWEVTPTEFASNPLTVGNGAILMRTTVAKTVGLHGDYCAGEDWIHGTLVTLHGNCFAIPLVVLEHTPGESWFEMEAALPTKPVAEIKAILKLNLGNHINMYDPNWEHVSLDEWAEKCL